MADKSKNPASPDNSAFHAWNPGLTSSIPHRLRPMITLYRPENATVSYDEALEAADFSGLPMESLAAFKTERLVVHELLVRVTADLFVADGPNYADLGISLRSMVERIHLHYMPPHQEEIEEKFEAMKSEIKTAVGTILDQDLSGKQTPVETKKKWFSFSRKPAATPKKREHNEKDLIENWRVRQHKTDDDLERACLSALIEVVGSITGRHGKLVADNEAIIRLASRIASNHYGSRLISRLIEPIFIDAVEREGYRLLPPQKESVVMNTKGASAAGKSTIRPLQRKLAEKLRIPWEDFAVISPDYWRKYLMDYDSLGEDYKYAAMLTGQELAIIDKKLDYYMAGKAVRQNMPHLLIDRFRFDSFKFDGEGDYTSNLLSQFGHVLFMFFVITSPAATVERAWSRGLTTSRYKAVDDLLYHNKEAFIGMPELFFSWLRVSEKTVYFEFLDNDQPLGERPHTIAFGQGDTMTILDPVSLCNIDRFRNVNIKATKPEETLPSPETLMFDFLKRCAASFSEIVLADWKTAVIYGRIVEGKWVYKNTAAAPKDKKCQACLEALGWEQTDKISKSTEGLNMDLLAEKQHTLGDWGGENRQTSKRG